MHIYNSSNWSDHITHMPSCHDILLPLPESWCSYLVHFREARARDTVSLARNPAFPSLRIIFLSLIREL